MGDGPAMLLRAAGRLIALGAVAGGFACIRDNWEYTPRGTQDAGPTTDATDATGASDASDASVVSPDAALADSSGNDAGAADTGVSDVGPADGDAGCPAGMAPIPAGQFLMGDPTGAEPLAVPLHGVRVSAFCLDLTEVTVAAYRACPSGSCAAPATNPSCNWGVPGRDAHPINCVTWDQARAYCQWRGALLPTEAQWEFAARGADGRLYPWGGDAPTSQLCWSGGAVQPGTCPARAFDLGASVDGVFDLGGGVAEFTADWFAYYTGNSSSYVMDPVGPSSGTLRVVRGGSWRSSSAGEVRAVYREGLDAAYATGVGFRCARPYAVGR